MANYFHLLIHGCRREQEDVLTQFCFSAGAQGVSEVLNFHQEDPSDYEPKTIESPIFTLEVFFQQKPDDTFFTDLKSNFSIESCDVKEEQEKDWLEEWKKGFESFELVSDIWVVPNWLEPPAAANKVIWMEPGMAFGTGTHDTTQLVAKLLAECNFNSGDKLLDVGTGSGILAILAAYLGIQQILGIDIEEESVRVATENIEKNNVADKITISGKLLSEVDTSYEWVVANIIDGVLLRLKADLLRCVKPGGHILLSGILASRWPHFKKEFIECTSLEFVKHYEQGEWIGALFRA